LQEPPIHAKGYRVKKKGYRKKAYQTGFHNGRMTKIKDRCSGRIGKKNPGLITETPIRGAKVQEKGRQKFLENQCSEKKGGGNHVGLGDRSGGSFFFFGRVC